MKITFNDAALIASLMLSLTFGGCVFSQPDPLPPSVDHEELARDAVRALHTVSEVALVFNDVAAAFESDELEDSEVRRDDLIHQDRGNDFVATTGLETPVTESCTSFGWDPSKPLQVSVIFDHCVLRSGQLLNGTATVLLEFDGTGSAIGVHFEELSIGTYQLDGFLVVSVTSEGMLRLDADLESSDEGDDLRIVFEGATLNIDESGLTLNGMGSFATEGETFVANAYALTWEGNGDCYPVTGGLQLSLPSSSEILVEFGVDDEGFYALVTVDRLPPTEMRLECAR